MDVLGAPPATVSPSCERASGEGDLPAHTRVGSPAKICNVETFGKTLPLMLVGPHVVSGSATTFREVIEGSASAAPLAGLAPLTIVRVESVWCNVGVPPLILGSVLGDMLGL